MSVTCSECLSGALVIRHAKRARFIILSPVTCLALPYFSTLSQMARISKTKKFDQKTCVLIFSTNSFGTFLILRTEQDKFINVYWS